MNWDRGADVKLTNKFMESATKWGNLYRFRYYINGQRVSDAEWRRAVKSAGIDRLDAHTHITKKNWTGWQTIWEA